MRDDCEYGDGEQIDGGGYVMNLVDLLRRWWWTWYKRWVEWVSVVWEISSRVNGKWVVTWIQRKLNSKLEDWERISHVPMNEDYMRVGLIIRSLFLATQFSMTWQLYSSHLQLPSSLKLFLFSLPRGAFPSLFIYALFSVSYPFLNSQTIEHFCFSFPFLMKLGLKLQYFHFQRLDCHYDHHYSSYVIYLGL